MNNREIVENFIAEKKKHNMKFFFIQLALDFVEAAVAVAFIMNALKNDKSVLGIAIVLFIALTLTIDIHIKLHFGSFKYFSWESHIVSDYNIAEQELKNAQKANAKNKLTDTELAAAQKKFDETIDEIAKKINAGFSK